MLVADQYWVVMVMRRPASVRDIYFFFLGARWCAVRWWSRGCDVAQRCRLWWSLEDARAGRKQASRWGGNLVGGSCSLARSRKRKGESFQSRGGGDAQSCAVRC